MRFFYLRDENNHPIGCVASDLVNGNISFAVSVCNPMDQFKKPQAKEIAAGRLAMGKCSVIIGQVAKGQVKRTIMQMITASIFPQKARDAAKLWLKNHPEPIQS